MSPGRGRKQKRTHIAFRVSRELHSRGRVPLSELSFSELAMVKPQNSEGGRVSRAIENKNTVDAIARVLYDENHCWFLHTSLSCLTPIQPTPLPPLPLHHFFCLDRLPQTGNNALEE